MGAALTHSGLLCQFCLLACFFATKAFRKATFTEVSSSKILHENSGFFNQNFGFFEPKLRFSYLKLRVFENRSYLFLNQSCSFCKYFFFVLPKLRVLIPGLFATETSEYQIHTKFLTKFRLLSGNRRNSRIFGRKWRK
jgi:hypothetical protein